MSTLIVGGGNMGSALIAGWVEQGRDPASIYVVESERSRAEALAQNLGVRSSDDADDLPADLAPEVVVLAVKPPLIRQTLPTYRRFFDAGAILLSIAAGVRLSALTDEGGPNVAAIRAMPNTPSAVGRGMTVLCANEFVSHAARIAGEALMRAVGDVAWIEDEAFMDAVTAVSGSGPAYVFHLAECLADAGVKAGLPASLADQLARQTVAGAGELLLQSGESPSVLRENVTSPGGTTAAALAVLMAEPGLRDLIADTVAAATARSREMAG